MSGEVLIQPLDLSEFTGGDGGPDAGFLSLFNDTVGGTGAPGDGFEEVEQELEGFVDALDGALSLLAGAEGGTLDDTFEEILALDAQGPADNAVAFADAAAQFSAGVDDLGKLLTDSSGGGGGGGTGGPGCDVDLGIVFGNEILHGARAHLTVVNNTSVAATVRAFTIKGTAGGTWEVLGDVPATLQPGDTLTLTVSVQHAGAGDFSAILTVDASNAAQPITYCLTLRVVSVTVLPPQVFVPLHRG